jgi:Ni/Co efflux regulator RcnB
MKKLMTLMLALSFMGATVAVSFADDSQKEGDTTKKKKKGKKKSDTDAPKAARR